MVDAHCHLEMRAFEDDFTQVLDRAWKEGIEFIVTVAVELNSGRRSLSLAKDPRIYVSLGIHPHYAGQVGKDELRVMEDMAHHPKVRAIGETGMDLYRSLSPRRKQEEVFRWHINLAEKLGLPLVIHCRDAVEEVLKVLDEEGVPAAGGMIHCFSGDGSIAKEFLRRGFYLSFSGVITYPKADPLREALKETPLDRLLSETDAPYLAPVPHRGRRNEPAFVVETVRAMAKIRGIPLEEMGRTIAENARKLFRIEEVMT